MKNPSRGSVYTHQCINGGRASQAAPHGPPQDTYSPPPHPIPIAHKRTPFPRHGSSCFLDNPRTAVAHKYNITHVRQIVNHVPLLIPPHRVNNNRLKQWGRSDSRSGPYNSSSSDKKYNPPNSKDSKKGTTTYHQQTSFLLYISRYTEPTSELHNEKTPPPFLPLSPRPSIEIRTQNTPDGKFRVAFHPDCRVNNECTKGEQTNKNSVPRGLAPFAVRLACTGPYPTF